MTNQTETKTKTKKPLSTTQKIIYGVAGAWILLVVGTVAIVSSGGSGSDQPTATQQDNSLKGSIVDSKDNSDTLTKPLVVAIDEETLKQFNQLARDNDRVAGDKMVYSGAVRLLEPGTRVYLVDAGFLYSQIRVEGETDTVTVVNELLTDRTK